MELDLIREHTNMSMAVYFLFVIGCTIYSFVCRTYALFYNPTTKKYVAYRDAVTVPVAMWPGFAEMRHGNFTPIFIMIAILGFGFIAAGLVNTGQISITQWVQIIWITIAMQIVLVMFIHVRRPKVIKANMLDKGWEEVGQVRWAFTRHGAVTQHRAYE